MSKPTNAQIAAARKAHNAFIGNVINTRVPTEDDENAAVAAALTAAAEVGHIDPIVNSAIDASVAVAKAATIERCAKVAESVNGAEFPVSGDLVQIAAKRIAAAIRALK